MAAAAARVALLVSIAALAVGGSTAGAV